MKVPVRQGGRRAARRRLVHLAVKFLRIIAFLLNAQTPLLPLNILLSLLLLVALLAGILLVLVALLVGMLLVLVALLPALLAKGILIVPDTPLTPLRVPLAMAALGNLDTVLAIVRMIVVAA